MGCSVYEPENIRGCKEGCPDSIEAEKDQSLDEFEYDYFCENETSGEQRTDSLWKRGLGQKPASLPALMRKAVKPSSTIATSAMRRKKIGWELVDCEAFCIAE